MPETLEKIVCILLVYLLGCAAVALTLALIQLFQKVFIHG